MQRILVVMTQITKEPGFGKIILNLRIPTGELMNLMEVRVKIVLRLMFMGLGMMWIVEDCITSITCVKPLLVSMN